jgi:hypothetical protein
VLLAAALSHATRLDADGSGSAIIFGKHMQIASSFAENESEPLPLG